MGVIGYLALVMDISVVIPTFNREKLLLKTLPNLVNQEAGNFSYEVIFVINGSTDGSEALLKDAAARWSDKISYLAIPPSGSPAAPRNVGIRAAKGNAVIIIDDDVLPGPGLVFHHADFHRLHPEPQFAAVGELTIPEEMLDDPVSFFHEFINYDALRGKDRLGFLDFWTCNVSVKRQFMLDYGMFDESLLYFEDVLCGYHLASRGMQLYLVSRASGQHLHQMKVSDVAAKGALIGRTLYVRLLNRLCLFSLSNPIFMAGLKFVATASRKRNRITDLYYYLLFRRNNLSAYSKAKRDARSRLAPSVSAR